MFAALVQISGTICEFNIILLHAFFWKLLFWDFQNSRQNKPDLRENTNFLEKSYHAIFLIYWWTLYPRSITRKWQRMLEKMNHQQVWLEKNRKLSWLETKQTWPQSDSTKFLIIAKFKSGDVDIKYGQVFDLTPPNCWVTVLQSPSVESTFLRKYLCTTILNDL